MQCRECYCHPTPDGRAHGVSAALEYGVGTLRAKYIVVLGHAQWGGVKAIDEDAELLRRRDVIHNWIRLNGTGGRKVGPRGALSHEDHLMRLTASIT